MPARAGCSDPLILELRLRGDPPAELKLEPEYERASLTRNRNDRSFAAPASQQGGARLALEKLPKPTAPSAAKERAAPSEEADIERGPF